MTIRSTLGRVVAYAWLVFAGLNIIDLFTGITGDPDYSLMTISITFVLLLGCGIAYTIGLRPAIVGDEEALTIRNPLRDVRVPWAAIHKIEGTNAVTVRFTGPDGTDLETRAWVHQTSPRAQAKAEARAERQARKSEAPALDLRGRTPTGFAARQLNEMRDRHRPEPGSGAPGKAAAVKTDAPARGTVQWSLPAVASLVVPLVALVVLLIISMLD
ncbi:PH domain-containing protein [Actinomadura formosensis]|uniref:PH domain-containing protein n=1 Tax=Actinomadura formosensis TaxID=60706 RepID=UPI000833A1D2|nr:PH domain-containing protein [Actinomadura formosensis]